MKQTFKALILFTALAISSSLAILTAATVYATEPTPPLAGADLAKYQNCQDDSDCVYAQNGSCDCNNGGTGVAINKTMLEEFRKNFAPATCTTIRGASCVSGIPRCEQNKCIYYARIIPHVYTNKKKN